MKKSSIILAMIVLLLAGCAKQVYDRSKSPDEMARQLLSQVPEVPERKVERVSTPPVERPPLPFEVYTWQPQDRADGVREIVILGKNLTEAKLLTIGDITIELTPREDGRSAVGRYPSDVRKELPIVITVGGYQVELPERFSPLKPEGLPRIHSCRFSWETVKAPERIPEVGGRSVEAVRFDCTVEDFEAHNAPVTVFIGPIVIPNSQIIEGKKSLTGYIYRTGRLEERMPVTIDFGQGLRVLAPTLFKLP